MDDFTYRSGSLHVESLPLARLAKEQGTPLYVYSENRLLRNLEALKEAFQGYPTLPCFAVKANGNLSLLKRIFTHGFGADVVSVGELERALVAGVAPNQVVFSGVGKTDYEIERALGVGIRSFNVESIGELAQISRLSSSRKQRAPISLRINPNIDAKTHPHIATGLYSTKFGIAEQQIDEALAEVKRLPALDLVGLDCHIGSQIVEMGPFREAARRMAELSKRVRASGFALSFLNLGGGLGIRYESETPPTLEEYAKALLDEIRPTGLELLLEPGRRLVADTGGLLVTVLGVKRTAEKTFLIVDGAMNDLIRPSLYEAHHAILPVGEATASITSDVVGPVCETGDFLGRDRLLPELVPGDLVWVANAGAYGFSMASNYNSRPRPAEVLVHGDSYRVIRPRERLDSLWAPERELLG